MPWSAPGGNLRLRLLASGGDGARRRSRLAPDLHAGRRVVAVLGVAHAPSSPDREGLRAEFQAACRAFPEALVSRCFVVDSDGDGTTAGADDNDDDDGALVLVPPAPDNEEDSNPDPDHPHSHHPSLDAAVASFGAAILQGLESAVLGSGPSSVRLPSPYADGPDFGGNNSSIGSSGAGSSAPQGALASLAAALGAAGPPSAGAGLSSGVAAAIGGGDGAVAAASAATTTTPTPPSTTAATPAPAAGPLEEALRARLAHGGGGGGGSIGSVGSAGTSSAAAAAAAVDEEQQLREKRRWGRLQKSKGDLALMAGSPVDAREHYRSGADLSRAAGDAVWAAAGLEGLAAARLAEAVLWVEAEQEEQQQGAGGEEQQQQQQQGPPAGGANGPPPAAAAAAAAAATAGPSSSCSKKPNSPTLLPCLRRAFNPALERDVRALCAEAARQYGRRSGPGPAALQAELALRLARLLAALRGCRARRDVLALTGAALDALPLLPSADDRVVALAEAAHCLSLAGCARKRALLLWHAGDQCRLLPDPQAGRVALRTLALALGQSGGGANQEEEDEDGDDDDLALSAPAPGLDEGDVGCSGGGGGGGGLPTSAAAVLHAAAASSKPRARRRQRAQQHWSLVLRESGLAAQRRQLSCTPDERSLAAEAGGNDAAAPWLPGTSYSGAPLPNFPPAPYRRQQHHAAAAPLCVLEALLSAARRAGAAEEAWEAAAALLRLHGWSAALPAAQQAALVDVLAQAAASFAPAARVRLSEGPGPLAALVRVAPAAPALTAFLVPAAEDDDEGGEVGRGAAASAGAASSGTAAASNGPFIFDAMAARRKQEGKGGKGGGGNNNDGGPSAAAPLPGEPGGPPAEWVCGDEGAVEIDLCNPTAVPLRLDDLRLDLEWEQEQVEEEQAEPNGGAGTSGVGFSSGGGGAPAPSRFVATPALSLTLPPGRAPVRVALAATPQRPGALRMRGLLASCWGVTWRVPLLPTAAAATSGGSGGDGGNDSDNGGVSATIRVLPRLPLLRAVLQGPDGLHAVRPAEGELAASPLLLLTAAASAAAAASSSAGGAGGPSDGGGGGASTPQPIASAAAVAAAGRPAPPVLVGAVLEGQRLRWALTLTNASRSAARRVKVSVAPAAAAGSGASLPPQQVPLMSWSGGVPVLPDGFVGAHVLVGAAESEGGGGGADSPGLPLPAAAAPGNGPASSSSSFSLPPGRSATVPLTVLVGRAPGPGDSLDNTALCLHVTYCGGGGEGEGEEDDEDDGGPGDDGELLLSEKAGAPRPRYGRRLNLSLRFAVQPSLTVTRARFAAAPVPLVGGAHAATTTNAAAVVAFPPSSASPPTPAWALAPAINVRSSAAFDAGGGGSASPGGGGGAAPLASSPSPSSPLRRAAAAAASQSSPPRSWPAAPLGAAAGPALGVGCDVVLELGLSNRSDRYYRAWVAPLSSSAAAVGEGGGGGGGSFSGACPGSPGAGGSPSRLAGGGTDGGAESAVAVLEPGDEACLLAALARHGATVAAGEAAAPLAGPSHNDLRSSAAGLAASGSGAGVDGASALSLAATEAAVVGAAPLVPPHGGGGGDSEWRRLVAGAASRVSSRLALCWEAITGDKAAERAQRGVLRLPAGLLARALLAAPQATTPTPQPMPALATGALAVLVPPALRLAVELVGGDTSQSQGAPVALADITDDLRRLGVAAVAASSAAATGQQQQQPQQQHAALARARAYGVRASPGDVLELRVAVALLGQQEAGGDEEQEEEVRLSVACWRRRVGPGSDDGDGGVLLSGALQGARVRLASRTGSHPFGAVCLSPGAYELTVRDVGLDHGGCAAAGAGRLRALPGGDASAMALLAPRVRPAAAAAEDPARSEVYAGVRPLLLVVV
jgi:hypothetical protein